MRTRGGCSWWLWWWLFNIELKYSKRVMVLSIQVGFSSIQVLVFSIQDLVSCFQVVVSSIQALVSCIQVVVSSIQVGLPLRTGGRHI